MALKHKEVSQLTADSGPDTIGGDDWNADHIVDAAGMTMNTASSAPAAPAAGNMILFAREVGGRPMPAFVGPSGLSSSLQPHIGRNRFLAWLPSGISGTVNVIGGSSTVGSPTGRSMSSTSLFQSMRRVGYVTAATANANASARGGGLMYFLSSTPRLGGFHMIWRFGTATYAPDGRVFIGLGAGNSAYGSVSPSSMLNVIGIGYDAGDTSWSVYHGDGAGLPTKIPLGAGFPCNGESVDVYDFVLFAAPGSASVTYTLTRLADDSSISGTISGDLPSAFLQPHLNVVNGGSAAVAGLDLMSMYIETDY